LKKQLLIFIFNQVDIESSGGFELASELTVKAHSLGCQISEVPTAWSDRTAGESRFQLMKWLPKYFRWYLYGLTHKPKKTQEV
jgi:hypothetical protein